MLKTKEFRDSIKNKEILVIGLGKSGKAAFYVANELGANVSVHDSNDASSIDAEFIDILKKDSAGMYLGREPEKIDAFDMLIVSPGVPTDLPIIKKAKELNIEVIGELEFAYRLNEGEFVAITGTNGKTTTTTLVGEIFEEANKKTSVVGNIGNPVVMETYKSDSNSWMIAETSSFQLETIKEFKPFVSAILNLTPDHLNRHKTMEAYAEAKARIFENQTKDNYLIINCDDEAVCALSEKATAEKIGFSLKKKLEKGAYLDGDTLYLNDGNIIRKICNRNELKIIGDHNVENVLAAAAICYFAGIEFDIISRVVKSFSGVEHRIEFCAEINGVKYYNDSKGTNVDASIIALKALQENIILIVGGDAKSQDFTDLIKNFDKRVKALVLLGRDAKLIEDTAIKHGFTNIYNVKNMEEVIKKSFELAEPGDKVLLSPACASWDMYPNFEIRGKHFKDCVKELCK